MGHNVSTDRLLVLAEHAVRIQISNHLIRDDDGDSELVSQSLQIAKELTQTHLTGSQFTASEKECRVAAVGHHTSKANGKKMNPGPIS